MLTTLTIVFMACKKDKSDDPAPPAPSPAEGFWLGKYTTNGVFGQDNYAMLIKAGGFVRIYDLGTKTDTSTLSSLSKVTGIWTLIGNMVQTTYLTGTKTVNTTATLNAAKTQMAGTWAFDGAVKGNIELSK